MRGQGKMQGKTIGFAAGLRTLLRPLSMQLLGILSLLLHFLSPLALVGVISLALSLLVLKKAFVTLVEAALVVAVGGDLRRPIASNTRRQHQHQRQRARILKLHPWPRLGRGTQICRAGGWRHSTA